jgi:alpha-1,2-mannosyltransferase
VTARVSSRNLLVAGAGVFVLALGAWLIYAFTHSAIYTQDPVDLRVYFQGGWIVRHKPPYNPASPYPLYGWNGATGKSKGSLLLPFTYTPFAAVAFVLASFLPGKINRGTGLPSIAPDLSIILNILLLGLAIWFTFRGLDVRDRRVRLGLTLLVAGLTFWMQPVLRTLYLGQVNLFLMALILWDLTQPKGRWWKGIGTGIAAGIKLVPLIFVPYLLVARRFRDAIGVIAGFLLTIVIGFLVIPGDSADWWFHGLFFQGKRTGFIGWEGNQSLNGLVTRLAGSIHAGNPIWLVSAAVAVAVGALAAGMLDRAGYPMPAILTAALSGLLASPISWDHHWVWVAPAVAVLGYYGYQFRETARSRALACYGSAVVLLLAFFAWPAAWFESFRSLGADSLGLIWMQGDTDPSKYQANGDQPSFVEYHWHGFQLIWGNTYVLVGMAAMIAAVVIALRVRRVAVSSPGTNRSPSSLMESAAPPPS